MASDGYCLHTAESRSPVNGAAEAAAVMVIIFMIAGTSEGGEVTGGYVG